jgi:hypothetical protein
MEEWSGVEWSGGAESNCAFFDVVATRASLTVLCVLLLVVVTQKFVYRDRKANGFSRAGQAA